MTLGDFLKRVDLEKDRHKMLLWCDGIGWSNLEIEIDEYRIRMLPNKNNSPFSSDK